MSYTGLCKQHVCGYRTLGCATILPLELIILPEGLIISVPFCRIYCTIYGTANLAIHHYGFHNSGAGPEGARPMWRLPKAASMLVDGEIGGSIYGAKYSTISGSKHGAETDNHSERIIVLSGRIIDHPYSGRIIAHL